MNRISTFFFIPSIILLITACKQGDYKSILKAQTECLEDVKIKNIDFKRINYQCLKGYFIDEIQGLSTNGNFISIGHSGYEVYILNTWFTTCAPCIEEMPTLNQLKDEFKHENISFISICRDDITKESEFIAKHDFYFEHLIGGEKYLENYLPGCGYPLTYITDAKGKIIETFRSCSTPEYFNNLKILISSLLNE